MGVLRERYQCVVYRKGAFLLHDCILISQKLQCHLFSQFAVESWCNNESLLLLYFKVCAFIEKSSQETYLQVLLSSNVCVLKVVFSVFSLQNTESLL